MSRNLLARRAGVLAGAVTAAVLGATAPAAAADVTVEPPSAAQGSGANVTFRVTNTAPAAITKVRLVLPKDTPVAEVFPLSVPDWAPQIENMKLTKPLTSIHGGTPVTETAAAITWTAAGGRNLAPGKSTELSVALGPLPAVSQMRFTLEPTYAGGKPGPALPAATLTLTPSDGQQAPGHASGHGSTGSATGDEQFAELVAQAEEDGGGFWAAAGWIVAALAGAAAVVALIRGRRRGAGSPESPAAEAEPDDAGEPVAAGAKVGAWSYRDGP